jgi:hypothetical protein
MRVVRALDDARESRDEFERRVRERERLGEGEARHGR